MSPLAVTLWWAYNGLFSLFGVVVIIQFVRKRRSLYLKDRMPYVSLFQLSFMLVICVSFTVMTTTSDLRTACITDMCFALLAADAISLAIFCRIWGLFWRIYLGKYLAASRERLVSQLEGLERSKSKPSVSDKRSSASAIRNMSNITTLPIARWLICARHLSEKAQLRVMKYFLPVFFATIVVAHVIMCWVSVFASDLCDVYGVKFNVMQMLVMPIMGSVLCLSAVIAWRIRKFRDNVGINSEIKQLFAVLALTLSALVVFMAFNLLFGGLFFVLFFAASIGFQVMFVVSGFLPLRSQHTLERKILSRDCGKAEDFDKVLSDDVAALVAFGRFMRNEFCEEMLEFWKAVTAYREAWSLCTSEKQRAHARLIFAQFLATDAPRQINVSATHLEAISLGLFDSTSVTKLDPAVAVKHAPSDVFDKAQNEMAKLMREGPFLRFQMQDELSTSATHTSRHDAWEDAQASSTPKNAWLPTPVPV